MTYTLTKSNSQEQEIDLKILMEASLLPGETKSTPVNLVNHSYFNLAGHDNKNGVLDHLIQIESDAFTPVDKEGIPTKEVAFFS